MAQSSKRQKNIAVTPESSEPPEVPASGPGFDFQQEDVPSFGASVQSWMDANSLDVNVANCYLYRIDQTGKRWLTDRYQGSIPDPADVGQKHGPGRYCMNIQVGRRSTTASMNIGPEFAAQVQTGANVLSPVTVQMPPGVHPGEQMRETFGLLRELLSIMSPLISAQQKAAPPMDLSAMMSGTMDVLQEVMKKSMRNQMELVADVQRAQMSIGKPATIDEGETAEGPTFVEKWLPLIEKFLPVLTGPAQAAKVTADVIRGTAEYQELVSDRNRLALVVNALEESFGAEKIKKALVRLNIIETEPEQKPEQASIPPK